MQIAVTGPRFLEEFESAKALQYLQGLITQKTLLSVGDASGLDFLAHYYAARIGAWVTPYTVDIPPGRRRPAWALAKRSKAMIDGTLEADSKAVLHAFPNKPCPQGLTVSSWKGSGTWGTLCYAVSRGMAVELHWLSEEAHPLPSWLQPASQLDLL